MKEKLASLNFSDSQKKILKLIGIFIGVVVALIIVLLIVKTISGGKVSYEQLENIMERAAKRYVNDTPELFVNEVSNEVYLSASELAKKGYMKDISKYVNNNITCDGNVIVYKNLDNYTYTSKLDCGKDYTTVLLVDKITEDVVSSGSGLYNIDTNYIYRGESVNNYIKFSNQIWRIVSIDSQNNLKIVQTDSKKQTVWDNRYNKDYKQNIGINDFQGIEPSRLKNSILSLYNSESTISAEDKAYIVPKEYCIGKRKLTDNSKDNSTECKTLSELMGASLLTVSDYMAVSLDEGCTSINSSECTNYNYLVKTGIHGWTVTAQSENTGYAYYISSKIYTDETKAYNDIFLVVNVTGNIKYKSGTGTSDDPFIIGKTK